MGLLIDQQPTLPDGTEELTGSIQAVLWSDWAKGEAAEGVVIAKIALPNTGEEKVVKGPCVEDGVEIGCSYRFLGRWVEHPQRGQQFSFSTFTTLDPATRKGVMAYLVKLCPNVGEAKARRLWERFGPVAVQVLRTDPAAVAAERIMTLDQAQEAADELAKFVDLEATRIDLFGLFDRRGFPRTLLDACLGRWGAQAGKLIRKNPFRLLTAKNPRLPGCGFRRVDKLYLDLGHDRADLKRQMLAAWNALREDSVGHTWLDFRSVRESVVNLIGSDKARPHEAIALGIRSRWLAERKDQHGESWISEARMAANERLIAEKVQLLRRAKCAWSDAPSDLAGDGIVSEHQVEKLKDTLREAVGILAGTPGTGKTYTAAQVVKWLACRFGLDSIAVAAPTGKAAVRITAAMLNYGLDIEATTIHRLLEVTRNGHDGDGWGFGRNQNCPLVERFVLVDEVSMLDTDLAAALFAACSPGTHVLLIGDPYQLPPVGHGAPLRDLIAASVPCGELTEIRRNAGLIVHACKQIKGGESFEVADRFDPDAGLNLRHLETANLDESVEFLSAMLSHFRDKNLFNVMNDVQVLVALNAKSKVSRLFLNRHLQGLLNPQGKSLPGNPFRVGDKVICTKNGGFSTVEHQVDGKPLDDIDAYKPIARVGQGSEIFIANGDQGRVLAIGPKTFVARFSTPDRYILVPVGKVREQAGDGDEDSGGNSKDEQRTGTGCDFQLAYAITTHKSQGSEWPCVVVMVDDSAGARRLASREHHYTSISRGKSLVVLIGNMGVLTQQCRKIALDRRRTFLKELLADARCDQK